ncbi:MAG: hypothetical protein JXN59_01020 [Anaerolineae bacterium]|nr:hypothetical protein [Anaerolineae bacterium]
MPGAPAIGARAPYALTCADVVAGLYCSRPIGRLIGLALYYAAGVNVWDVAALTGAQ